MPSHSHQFGVIMFLPLSQGQIQKGSAVDAGWIHPPQAFDPEDPFCYHCGQKYINAKDAPCPGKTATDARIKLYV